MKKHIAAPKIGKGKTVILANDSVWGGDLRNKIEDNLGCNIIWCENIEEVLQALNSNKVDILVLDNKMPTGKDGITEHFEDMAEQFGAGVALTEHIRSGGVKKSYTDIPIIIASAQLEPRSYEKLLTLDDVWVGGWNNADNYVAEILQDMATNKESKPVIDDSTTRKLHEGLSECAVIRQNTEYPGDRGIAGTTLIQNDSDYVNSLRIKAGMTKRLLNQGLQREEIDDPSHPRRT